LRAYYSFSAPAAARNEDVSANYKSGSDRIQAREDRMALEDRLREEVERARDEYDAVRSTTNAENARAALEKYMRLMKQFDSYLLDGTLPEE
jgi:hypothetical protein